MQRQLQDLSGGDFDLAYPGQVADHQKTAQLFEPQIGSGGRAVTGRTRNTHYEAAR